MPAPEQVQQIEVAMVGVHAGATQLDHFAAKWFVRREIEFPLAVVSEFAAASWPVCNRYVPTTSLVRDFFDDQVIAELIEWIDIEPGQRATRPGLRPVRG